MSDLKAKMDQTRFLLVLELVTRTLNAEFVCRLCQLIMNE